MALPLFLAHGPPLGVFVIMGLLWLLVAIGLPVLALILGKRGHRFVALAVGGASVALTGFVAVLLSEETFPFYFGLVLLPLILSVVVFAKVIQTGRPCPPAAAPPSPPHEP